jgi:magnesium transporter
MCRRPGVGVACCGTAVGVLPIRFCCLGRTEADVTQTNRESWEELHGLIESAGGPAVEQFIASLDLGERIRAVSTLNQQDRDRLLAMMSPDEAAELIELIPEVQAIEVIEHLEPAKAAAIIAELPSDVQADVVQQLAQEDAERLLSELTEEDAEQIRALARYDLDVAGGLMVKEYLAYRDTMTVGEVVSDLRSNAQRYRDYHVQYAYVIDDLGKLEGVLQLRELLLRSGDEPLHEVAFRNAHFVRDDDPLERLEQFFDEHSFFGAPVVDRHGRLVGVVHRADIEEAIANRSDSDYLKSQGIVGGEELRSMPLGLRSRKRLSWLSINIVLNIIAASVIAVNQDVLDQVIVLAVFLPIISDMSGCSGNQAVAVSMRELSLGVAQPKDIFRVLGKEAVVGAMNGLALGLLIGLVAGIWQGNFWLALVVGVAMSVNTVVAVCIGGCVPLFLRGVGKDPALASGPILTTVTDMCGFFLVLSFAGLLLNRLTDDADSDADGAAEAATEAASAAGAGAADTIAVFFDNAVTVLTAGVRMLG